MREIKRPVRRPHNKNSRSQKLRKLKLILAAVAAVLLTILLIIGIREFVGRVTVGIASNTLIGMDYENAEKTLKSVGFTKIQTVEVADLPAEKSWGDKKVTEVKIGSKTTFTEKQKFPPHKKVVITYHTLQRISPPFSLRQAKKQNYEDVKKAFVKAGFKNIQFDVKYDLITGWITHVGNVKSITIEGKKYSEKNSYRPDVEILITYHDLRKNDPYKDLKGD